MHQAYGGVLPPQSSALPGAFNFVLPVVSFIPVEEITYDSGWPGEDVTPINYVEFWWPFGGPSVTLSLKTPEFGDEHSTEFAGIVRGQKESQRFQDTNWQDEENLSFTIIGIKEADKDTLMTMISDSLGTPVGFRDWEDRVWKVIFRPGIEATESDKNDRFTMKIDLLVDSFIG